jgi:hypothetical protein
MMAEPVIGLFHDLPAWAFASLTIAVFVGLSLSGLAVTRSWVRRRGLHALVDNGVIGWMFSAILVIYAIAIGLICVATWGNASRATNEASDEAARIAAIYRDFGGYPEPLRTELRRSIVRYARYVIDVEWPMQRRGDIPHRGTDVLTDLQRVFYAFEPTTDAQRIIHAEAMGTFNELIETRRTRIEAVDYAVPDTLWGVVLAGAVISIMATWVFSMDSLAIHGLMTSLLAAMIALLVFFIAWTDRPYRGSAGVAPIAYELVLEDMKHHDPTP